ncbi:MAG: pyridoxal-phosphate-dependent aminotransferase family protein [Burkholderiaceae bacterium]
MKRIPGLRFLHSPGPTHIPDEVLDAMHRQPMDLADGRLDQIIADCESGLKHVLQTTTAAVSMFASNAHGGWEACIENLVGLDEAVLIPATGHFSQQWALQTEALGREVITTPWREGYALDPEQIEQVLRADTAGRIAAVFVVHTDTSSSVTNDLAAIRAAIDASGHAALMVVDVVATLGAAPFSFDELGVNAAIGGSQKGLMMPPGLSFVAVDDRAREKLLANPTRRFYWNFERRQTELSYLKFCGTPPEIMLMGMQASMRLIQDEGLDNVIKRHARLASAVQAAVTGWGARGALELFAKQPHCRSVSVTTVEVASGIDPEAIRTVAREQFQVAMAGGNGALAGRVFRIGHLGDMNTAMILGCLGGVQAALLHQGVAIGEDGVSLAIARLAATAEQQ